MIVFEQYSFKYNNNRDWALKEINLELKQGIITILAGASGSGKSTLLKAIAGIIPNFTKGITRGFNATIGMDVARTSLNIITQKAGILFQNADAQFFNLSVEDEICFGMLNRGWDKHKIFERMEEMLRFFQLQDVRHLPCQALSEGQKQKTILASIMAVNPSLLLLDEPFAHLDSQQVNDLIHELKKLKKQGTTIIIAEHRLDKISEIADRVLVLKNGEVKEEAPAEWLNSNENRKKYGLREKTSASWQNQVYAPPTDKILTGIKNGLIKYNSGFEREVKNFLATQGSQIVIKGTNGSGKTSILKILSGLKKLASGHTIPGKIKPGSFTSMALQQTDNQLFMDTVEDEILAFSKDKNFAETMLLKLGLDEYRKINPFCLSEGQKQRVVLASVFSRKTPVILLDEPTTGMDGEQLELFTDMLNNVSSNEQACILATHDETLMQKLDFNMYNIN
ncbi:MAG: ATP-binding cassette domain-containing protein [Bacteroidota bacterium]